MVGGRRLALVLAVAALAFVALASGGCEAIVSDQIPGYACSGAALSACPKGMYCKGTGCTACEKFDICDGYDNDCNGLVDDGPLSDFDKDGYTVCGHFDAEGGAFRDVDCDDHDPTVHPNAPEICNGRDNDCDGDIDNPCPATQVCLAKTQSCVDKTSACSVTTCPPPQVCDQDTQKCVAPPSVDLGGSCSSNTACRSNICGDASILGGDFVSKNGAVCTQPCCTSADCGPAAAGFVCFSAGTGGNYCVSKASVGLNRATGPLGAATGGGACPNGNGDCRSGLCGANRKCLDSCCGDGDCTTGTSCTLNTATGHNAFQCADSQGGGGQNASCNSDSDCKGGFCFEYGNSFDPLRHCVSVCCGSSSCGSVDFGFPIGSQTTVCYDITGQDDPRMGGDVALVCIAVSNGTGNAQLGDACRRGSDCRSARCDARVSKCTDLCCRDSDCATPRTPGWTCRPTPSGSTNYLQCQAPG